MAQIGNQSESSDFGNCLDRPEQEELVNVGEKYLHKNISSTFWRKRKDEQLSHPCDAGAKVFLISVLETLPGSTWNIFPRSSRKYFDSQIFSDCIVNNCEGKCCGRLEGCLSPLPALALPLPLYGNVAFQGRIINNKHKSKVATPFQVN